MTSCSTINSAHSPKCGIYLPIKIGWLGLNLHHKWIMTNRLMNNQFTVGMIIYIILHIIYYILYITYYIITYIHYIIYTHTIYILQRISTCLFPPTGKPTSFTSKSWPCPRPLSSSPGSGPYRWGHTSAVQANGPQICRLIGTSENRLHRQTNRFG